MRNNPRSRIKFLEAHVTHVWIHTGAHEKIHVHCRELLQNGGQLFFIFQKRVVLEMLSFGRIFIFSKKS